jgi:hypothetical protein
MTSVIKTIFILFLQLLFFNWEGDFKVIYDKICMFCNEKRQQVYTKIFVLDCNNYCTYITNRFVTFLLQTKEKKQN